jgi:hypothetical protein
MNIKLICGYIGHGKDLLAELYEKKYFYTKLNVATYIKKYTCNKYKIPYILANTQNGKKTIWNSEQNTTVRDLIILESNNLKKQYGNTVFIDKIIENINKNNLSKVVIADFRYPIEYEKLVETYGKNSIEIINIIRLGYPIEELPSEHQLDSFIKNNKNDIKFIINDGKSVNSLLEQI